jgi:tripartite-type tricarboxylate transporter receptor subunit TctC
MKDEVNLTRYSTYHSALHVGIEKGGRMKAETRTQRRRRLPEATRRSSSLVGRKAAVVLAGLGGLLLLCGTGGAQPYPARPIRILVGFTAGGATDLSARFLAQKLSETIGQQVVVEDRPGAGSMLAAESVARSAPDGYTMLVANVTIAMPSMFAKLSFDVRKDLVPVTLVGFGQVALIVHPSLPVKSVKELVALAKRKPGTLNYGSAGTGSFTHLAMALLESMTDIKMVHVPYKGSTQASLGVMTGEAQLLFSSPAAVIGQIKEGRLRAIGVSGTTRTAILPDVPAIAEAGVPGYDATSWYGMLAPTGAPRTAISKLSEESIKALGAADLKERLLAQGIDPAKGGVEEFAAILKAEIPKWAKVIKAAGIPPQ